MSGPPVILAAPAISAIDTGSCPSDAAPSITAAPPIQATWSTSTWRISAARSFICPMRSRQAWTTAMPVANVARLPSVMSVIEIDSVSTTVGVMWWTSSPSSSAAISAIDARLPPMSGLPVITVAVPSSLRWTVALDCSPMLNQNPVAMPRPAPSGTGEL